MKVKGTIVITTSGGEKVLVLLATAPEDLDRLHQYLTIDAYQLKKTFLKALLAFIIFPQDTKTTRTN